MVRSIFISLFFLSSMIYPDVVHGSFEIKNRGGRAQGMAVQLVADVHDPSTRSINPCSASLHPGLKASFSYIRQWGLRELDRFQITTVYAEEEWSAGLSAFGFGRGLYEERVIDLSFAKRVIHECFLGASLRRNELKIENYYSDTFFAGTAGILFSGTRGSIGASISGFTLTEPDHDADMPLTACCGGMYNVSPRVRLCFEVYLESGYSTSFATGMEYKVLNKLELRSGYDSGSGRVHIGISILTGTLSCSIAYDHHSDLGWTRAYGVTYY